LLCILYVERRD